MQPFHKHVGQVVPINKTDIDTDIIVPAEFLKRIERTGFGKYLMYYWRYDENGRLNKQFPLNQNRYKNSTILLTGDNFGCGSSRENAVWALYEYGFRVVIAPSIADIFKNNCSNNGLLTIELDKDVIDLLFEHANEKEILKLEIDLIEQIITDQDSLLISFDIDQKIKHKFINGLDDIDLTMSLENDIAHFEFNRPSYLNPYRIK